MTSKQPWGCSNKHAVRHATTRWSCHCRSNTCYFLHCTYRSCNHTATLFMFAVEVMTEKIRVSVWPTYSTREQAHGDPTHHGYCIGQRIQCRWESVYREMKWTAILQCVGETATRAEGNSGRKRQHSWRSMLTLTIIWCSRWPRGIYYQVWRENCIAEFEAGNAWLPSLCWLQSASQLYLERQQPHM